MLNFVIVCVAICIVAPKIQDIVQAITELVLAIRK